MTTSDDLTTIPLKRCTKCSEEKPATTEYFHRNRTRKDGLNYWCKQCWIAKNSSPSQSESRAKWRASNPEYAREYYQLHSEAIYKRSRPALIEWRRKNQEHLRAYNHLYNKQHSLKICITKRRRRHKIQSLPSTFTSEQWRACLEYFHHTCAYCGAQQSFWFVLEQEHFIPVAAGGGYIAENIIPACKSCNSSKNDNDPNLWVVKTFGKRRAEAILARIDAYFGTVKG